MCVLGEAVGPLFRSNNLPLMMKRPVTFQRRCYRTLLIVERGQLLPHCLHAKPGSPLCTWATRRGSGCADDVNERVNAGACHGKPVGNSATSCLCTTPIRDRPPCSRRNGLDRYHSALHHASNLLCDACFLSLLPVRMWCASLVFSVTCSDAERKFIRERRFALHCQDWKQYTRWTRREV